MLQQLWAEKLWALHLNLWKPLSPCQREIGSVDNPNIFNFVLSDTEEMCQHWGPTASKHRSLTSNNLDSTSPPVLSHRRSATFISFRSRSVDQKRRLSSLNKKQQHCKCFHGHSLVSLVGYAWVSAGWWYHLWVIQCCLFPLNRRVIKPIGCSLLIHKWDTYNLVKVIACCLWP